MPKRDADGLTKWQRYERRHPERRKAAYKKWREENAERLRELRKVTYAQDPEKQRFINLKRWYGVTREDYESMMKRQNHACAICRTPFSEVALKQKRRPSVDHCHKTGMVRGILCHPCNMRLSAIEDKPWRESAMRYLARKEGG